MPTTNINLPNTVPEIELVGDWAKAKNLFKTLQPAVLLGAKQGQISAANKIMAMVKKNIRQGGPKGVHWPRYSLGYEIAKTKRGGNTNKFWRLTDTYYNAIRVDSRGTRVTVGVPRNSKGRANPKKPLTLGQIANILERGSATMNIAARPLWAPTFKEFGGKQRVASHVIFHIRRNIYLASGIRAGNYTISL